MCRAFTHPVPTRAVSPRFGCKPTNQFDAPPVPVANPGVIEQAKGKLMYVYDLTPALPLNCSIAVPGTNVKRCLLNAQLIDDVVALTPDQRLSQRAATCCSSCTSESGRPATNPVSSAPHLVLGPSPTLLVPRPMPTKTRLDTMRRIPVHPTRSALLTGRHAIRSGNTPLPDTACRLSWTPTTRDSARPTRI